MNDDIFKSIDTISLLVDGLDKLTQQLKVFTDSYSGIEDSVSKAKEIEEKASSDMAETLPLMQSLTEKQSDGSQKLEILTDVLENSVKQIKNVCGTFEKTLLQLQSHSEILNTASATLEEINSSLEQTPSIAESSSAIQKALGAISDPGKLEDISEKLDLQTKAINLEREEIIKPLKNAAIFSDIVKEESNKIQSTVSASFETFMRQNTQALEKNFSVLSSDDPSSFNGKLELLLENSEKICMMMETASQSSAKSSGLKGLFNKKQK